MQGLADGYFVIPNTISDYLSNVERKPISTEGSEFEEVEKKVKDDIKRLLDVKGKKTVHEFQKELGHIMWNHCGMARNEAGLHEGIEKIKNLRKEFWMDVNIPGADTELNQNLEKAGRLADFLELGELMMHDALHRKESCGGHFREEHQTPEGEALRDDDNFAYVAAWEYQGENKQSQLHKEVLDFKSVELTQRSYK